MLYFVILFFSFFSNLFFVMPLQADSYDALVAKVKEKVAVDGQQVDYDALVTKVQQKSAEDQQQIDYNAWAEEAERQKDTATAKAIVADVERELARQDFAMPQRSAEADIISLPQMQRDYQAITAAAAAAATAGDMAFEKSLFVLVSLSMPEELLKNLDALAERIGARLVLRGFKDNSFKKTVAHIKQLQERGIKLEINPNLFKALRVEMVPSFILVDGSKIDIMQGNVSLPYVLEKFAESGDAKELAQQYLKALKS